MNTKNILGVLLIAAALVYAALPAYSAETPKPYVADPKAKEITIDMKAYKYAFDPGDLTVYKGQKITLNITALDRKHGLKLDAYDINVTVVPGTVTTVTFVADETGEFPFKCSVFCGPGHMSMKGVLKVIAP
jgi:heme/copper-type cytochrome/quinol oxidase subunit 2